MRDSMLVLGLLLLVGTLAAAEHDVPLTGAVVKWEKFFDRAGNAIAPPTDDVSDDSLYFKDYYVTTYLRSAVKGANPAPANRTPFTWQNNQNIPCMSPDGEYVYEIRTANLRRFSTTDGSYTDYPLSHPGDSACGTDGQYLYVLAANTVHKYTLTGGYINTTTVDVTPFWASFSVVRDTVWLSPYMGGATTYFGYACSRFVGGSISYDATWNVGNTGSSTAVNFAWDGTYYYLATGGYASNPFYRFYADRTLYSSGTLTGDARSVMCTWTPPVTGPKVLVAGAYSDPSIVKRVADTLALHGSGCFSAYDTIDARVAPAPSAASLWAAGYRAILAYSDSPWSDAAGWGNMLAEFVEMGGGAVVTCFADYNNVNYCLGGAWNPRYTLWDLNLNGFTAATLGTVHVPAHPIMTGVNSVGCSNWRTAATTPKTSSYVTRISDWASGNLECVAYDSASTRVAYLGFYMNTQFIGATMSGDWIRQVNNALEWSAQAAPPAPKALVAGCYGDGSNVKRMADTLALHGSGYFGAYDTVNAAYAPAPSAASLWAAGYRAILTYSDYGYSDRAAWGNTLKDFVDMGGGVVVTVFADQSSIELLGAWNPRYTLWNVNANAYSSGTLGTVYVPAHPIMTGVSTVGCANYRTAATTPKASAYTTRIADWAEGTLECVAYDSSDRRVAYIGFYAASPFIPSPAPNSGDWIRQLNNALEWSASGAVVGVEAPTAEARPVFRVWPNPTRGIVNLTASRTGADALVSVHDVLGRCVLTRTLEPSNPRALSLDLRDLAAGVYLVKVSDGGHSTAQKLVVQH